MHPIISALKHHKTTVILVALEIALTCTIVINALFLIGDRLGAMQVTTGVADNELVWIRTSGLRDDITPAGQASRTAADLAALRAMPGVKSVAMTNSLPLTPGGWSTCVHRQAGETDEQSVCPITMYLGTSGFVGTLGITLVKGRDFLPQEYADYAIFSGDPPPSSAIVTHALAERLWPGENPVGKPIHMGPHGKYAVHVVGVTSHLIKPSINKPGDAELNLLLPVRSIAGGRYVLRTNPAARGAVLHDAPKVLERIDDQRIITDIHSYADSVRDYWRGDRAMIWLLLVVIGCLLALTALGVVGLSSFWVQQRTHTIGIRRAIGATRRDILRYFLAENFLIVSFGIVVGCAGAVGLNLWLMQHYELHRMPLFWLPAGAAVLWLLGQLAVLGPAMRAANVPPVVATRSV
ncbi:MAG TPA: FtsX-like permease family protein [Oleiagrimonas sp.]|nr:FtsX-like permease family protein [Oleiagrimonas sp.]